MWAPCGNAAAPDRREEDGGLRPSSPLCPRCDCHLEGVRHATGIAWRCGSCGGQSVNFSQFRRMIPEARVDEIWVTTTEKPVAAPGRTRCPECRRGMTAVLIPSEDREIELDICRPCQRLWLENQEALAKTLDAAKNNARAGPKPPLVRMDRRGADDRAQQDFQEKLAKVRAFMIREKQERRPWTAPLVILVLLYLVFEIRERWRG
ncbi:MAG: hypothetical protein V4726_05555 [Verrucomicrobiota bacterium]